MRKQGHISRTTFYRRRRETKRLGCSVDELPDNRGKCQKPVRGSRHHRWKNGLITNEGYILVRVGKSHPLADPNGYAYEHLLVWVSAGDTLKSDEVLHHINSDRQDNRWGNLQKMTRSAHNILHNENKLRDKLGRFINPAVFSMAGNGMRDQ